MKLKVERINNHIVLVDEKEKDVKEGSLVIHTESKQIRIVNEYLSQYEFSIILAEKELVTGYNLNVPILPNWREWEVEQAFKNTIFGNKISINSDIGKSFIAGYNHNKAKYTEEDLREAYRQGNDDGSNNLWKEEAYIQSLQKYPKYIVIESYEEEEYIGGSGHTSYPTFITKPRLITNSERKLEAIIKELIW